MSDAPSVPEWSQGDRLRKARDSAGLDQDDLAMELGVSRQAISKWENGAPIKRAYVKVWAVRCGVPFEWLDDTAPTGTDIARHIQESRSRMPRTVAC